MIPFDTARSPVGDLFAIPARWRQLWLEHRAVAPDCRLPLVVGLQLGLVLLSNYLAFWLRFDGAIPPAEFARCLQTIGLLVAIRGIAFVPFKLYAGLWQYTGISDLCNIVLAVASSSTAFYLVVVLGMNSAYSRSVFVIDSILLVLFLSGIRLSQRIARRLGRAKGNKRVLIFGAGDAGEMIVRDMYNRPGEYEALGLIDDDPVKIGRRIHGVPVLGTREDIGEIIAQTQPHELLVAMPGADAATVRGVVEILQPYKVPVTTLPSVRDILDGRVTVSQIRDLTVEDLLPRAPIDLNIEPVRKLIGGSRVLVTGAGGSIGSELCRQIAALGPASLVLFERYENSLYAVTNDLVDRFGSDGICPVIGDVTDASRVDQVLEHYRPQIIFHAAAHKHVPLMEHNPCEAVKNNVAGTATIARAADRWGVERFIMISTDKAVNPSSIMGATKRVGELLLQVMSSRSATRFATVRFGNVLGSNGSVVPRFVEQIQAGGPVTVTHPDIRRFFMLIPEAVQLVLHAAVLGEPGTTYVLDMGEQIKLVELARNVIRLSGFVPGEEIPITFIGLRPGEKLYEELIGAGETAEPSPVQKIMRIRDESRCDPQTLQLEINRLLGVAMQGDTTAVVRQLRTMLPTFEPPAHTPTGDAALPAARSSEGTSRKRTRRRKRAGRRIGAVMSRRKPHISDALDPQCASPVHN
jgi:FlaA1/EpsC-like NDP-sugar epimerase